MKKEITLPSAQRLLALVIFLGLPAILLGFTIVNLLQIDSDRFAVAERDAQIAAYDRRLSQPAPDGKPLDTSRIYVSGASRTLASANLQARLVEAVSATSGRLIETVNVEVPVTVGAAEGNDIRLKATLDIDNNGLLQLLYIVESGVPLLEIEALSVRRLPNEATESKSELLRVDMTVRGNWKNRVAS